MVLGPLKLLTTRKSAEEINKYFPVNLLSIYSFIKTMCFISGQTK